MRELTGCAAKKRGTRSSLLPLAGGRSQLQQWDARLTTGNPQHVQQVHCSKARKSDCLWACQKRTMDRLA